MVGLIGFLPFTYTAIIIGSLSLIALPWLTGFYSKDLILEIAYGQYLFHGYIAYWFGTISAGLTAFYSFRLISLTFLTYPNANKNTYSNVHDASITVIIPLTILSILAIFFGYIAKDLFVGIGSDFFGNSLFTHPNNIYIVEAEFGSPIIMKLFPIIITIIGASLSIYLYNNQSYFISSLTDNKIGIAVYRFFNQKYFVDVIVNHYIINSSLKLGYILSKVIDRGIIEIIGPYGFTNSLNKTSFNISTLDTGIVTSYAVYIAVSIIVIFIILFIPFIIIPIDVRLIFVIIIAFVFINKLIS